MVSFVGLCWAVFMAAPLSPSLALRSECYALPLLFLSLSLSIDGIYSLYALSLVYSYTPFLCLGRLGIYLLYGRDNYGRLSKNSIIYE